MLLPKLPIDMLDDAAPCPMRSSGFSWYVASGAAQSSGQRINFIPKLYEEDEIWEKG